MTELAGERNPDRERQLAATMRLPFRMLATFPVSNRVAVAVTRDQAIALVLPDGLAVIDPDDLVKAVIAAEAWRDDQPPGPVPVTQPCPVVVAEVCGHAFICTAGPAGHLPPHVYAKPQP